MERIVKEFATVQKKKDIHRTTQDSYQNISTEKYMQFVRPNRSYLSADIIPIQRKQTSNNTGLPDNLKNGIETISGFSMEDVKVHYNSSKPTQFQALAYTQGTDIHVAPGQERNLPHEAWHVVQQKQGRVAPNFLMNGIGVNDNGVLENEADIMGSKAVTIQGKFSDTPIMSNVMNSCIQRIVSGSILNGSITGAITVNKPTNPVTRRIKLGTRSKPRLKQNILKLNFKKAGKFIPIFESSDPLMAGHLMKASWNNDSSEDEANSPDIITQWNNNYENIWTAEEGNIEADAIHMADSSPWGPEATRTVEVINNVTPTMLGNSLLPSTLEDFKNQYKDTVKILGNDTAYADIKEELNKQISEANMHIKDSPNNYGITGVNNGIKLNPELVACKI